MNKHRFDYSLAAMCQCFTVSRSGYYAWRQRKPSQRHPRRQALDEQIKTLFHQHKQRYGAERLQRKMPERCDLKTIAVSLRRQGLVAKAARKFKATTNSKHHLPVFDNLLQQDFSASAPNQKWTGDMTRANALKRLPEHDLLPEVIAQGGLETFLFEAQF